jgi:CheY-like chemotaxis protein
MPIEENTPSSSLSAALQPPGGAVAKKNAPAQPANLIQINGTTLPESFAHDLNNQISIINGYSEVCLGHLGNGHKDEKLEKYLNAIHHATQQAAQFTRQLVALGTRKKSSAAASYKGFPQGDESVFVIEDDAVLRDMLRTVLTQHGYKITLAGTGEQATKVFSTSPKAFDIVLLDLQLPDTTGLIVLNRIRQLRPAQKVIAVSGHIDAETTTVLKRLGVQDNLLKPYHLADLGRAIRNTLAHAV